MYNLSSKHFEETIIEYGSYDFFLRSIHHRQFFIRGPFHSVFQTLNGNISENNHFCNIKNSIILLTAKNYLETTRFKTILN